MPAVVAIPQVVEELLVQFGDIFPNQPARRHFASSLTGLFIVEHKTVSGITREFADTTDQSCLNRFLTEAPWDVERINTHRLEWLQSDPATRYRQDGVIAIDNTLIDHDGEHQKVGGHAAKGIVVSGVWIGRKCGYQLWNVSTQSSLST
jgi:hypothetical protein